MSLRRSTDTKHRVILKYNWYERDGTDPTFRFGGKNLDNNQGKFISLKSRTGRYNNRTEATLEFPSRRHAQSYYNAIADTCLGYRDGVSMDDWLPDESS